MPVTMETLLVFVTEGMALLAGAWKPVWTQRDSVGKVLLDRPAVRYSGSKPSMQTTTVGRVGML
jgi:hypothetical protein